MTETLTSSPFSEAPRYRDLGWMGTLPLPARAKKNPPGGFTGGDGVWPTDEHIAAWNRDRPGANICLRLPENVLGVDVDDYDGKNGAASLAECEAKWGPLPPTVMTSAREHGLSGIRLYRVPTGLDWPNVAGEHIEIVRHGYRYAVVEPSLHPEGATYRWRDSTDRSVVDAPRPDDLPDLPVAWVEALIGGRLAVERGPKQSAQDVQDWRDSLPGGEPTEDVREALRAYERALDGGDRHVAGRDVIEVLAAAGAGGAPGVPGALAMARDRFILAVPERDAETEWDNMLAGTVRRLRSGALLPHVHWTRLVFTYDSGDLNEVLSWAPVNLAEVLDGKHEPAVPTMLPRTDGVSLLYPGLTHSFHGESESGKSLLLQIEAARLVAAGRPVLFIDFESDARTVILRLMAFGASRADVLDHFRYVRPEVDPREVNAEGDAFREMLSHRYDLAVIDGVTDALGTFGYSTKDNDDITRWTRVFPRVVADRTGAAVALIDHVTKDSGTRGRFAIGGQAKMSVLTGAAYTVEVTNVLGIGRVGRLSVRIGKDRPGRVRQHGGSGRASDRTQEIAVVTIDSRDESAPVVRIDPPEIARRDEEGHAVAHPQELMERVSVVIEKDPGLSVNMLRDSVGGKRVAVIDAVNCLVEGGYVAVENGARGSRRHTSVRPFRRAGGLLDFTSGADG